MPRQDKGRQHLPFPKLCWWLLQSSLCWLFLLLWLIWLILFAYSGFYFALNFYFDREEPLLYPSVLNSFFIHSFTLHSPSAPWLPPICHVENHWWESVMWGNLLSTEQVSSRCAQISPECHFHARQVLRAATQYQKGWDATKNMPLRPPAEGNIID